jgi:hypothetical protein
MTDTDIQNKDNNSSVDEKILINEAVNYINDKIGNSYYNTAVEIGDYILKNFFNDDIKKVKSKLSNKDNSFSKLCQNSDLKIHPKHLNQMVLIAAQEKLFKENIKKELNYSLKVELLKVNNKQKIIFAEHFIKNKFTIKQAKEYLKEKLGTVTGLDIIPFNRPLIAQFKKIYDWSQIQEIEVDFSKIKSVYRAKETIKNIDDFILYIDNLLVIKKKLEDTKEKVAGREKTLKDETEKKKAKKAVAAPQATKGKEDAKDKKKKKAQA